MRHLPVLLILSAAFAAMPAAAQTQNAPALRDFSLPPAPNATATPRAQGPVDEAGPVPVAPRVIATSTPRPAVTPAPTQPPVIRLPNPSPTAAATPRAAASPRPRTIASPASNATPLADRPTAPVLPPPPSILALEPEAAPTTSATPLPQATAVPFSPAPATQPVPAGQEGSSLTWLLLAALGLAGLVGGAVWFRRRQASAKPLTIERPLVTPSGAANDDGGTPADALKIELAAVKLTRSFMNASLAYRITLHNRGARALAGVTVAGELIGAHGSQPLENQIASNGAQLPQLHQVERLSLGQARTLEGTLTLPLQAITPIRQGSAALFVPLLRLVVSGEGMEPLARTFVVGQPSAGMTGRLQPFRLDEPPRSYQPIGQRALD